ncbi:PAS domain-containing protein [Methylogaea oryzae]|uniref:PAS domain-containing protein n=1 Tax=Methylogaea oryzae TaxID=1295382 RepID=UPI0012E0E26C|nr:PAS domain-containing protein [Methylogaea oryzae]
MKINLPVTDREIRLSDDTQIISTTDLKGIITYADEDFVRIAQFSKEELLGKNHNIVRHPDMPEAAFADLWATIKSNHAWMGIVKNRAKNGDYYWVDAFVTPMIEDDKVVGYESVRVKPNKEYVDRAAPLYKAILDKKITKLPAYGSTALHYYKAIVALLLPTLGAIGWVGDLFANAAFLASAQPPWFSLGRWHGNLAGRSPKRRSDPSKSSTTRSPGWFIPAATTMSGSSKRPRWRYKHDSAP